jgi:hypothetical protein
LLLAELQNNQDRILQNVTCQWGRQMGLSSCPSSVSRMCRLDFSSRAAFLTSYGNSPAEDVSASAGSHGTHPAQTTSSAFD